jgi:hypothetical protein
MEPATRVAEAIADDAVATTEYYGHVGRTTVGAALSRFSDGDMLVHREDIARTVGGWAPASRTPYSTGPSPTPTASGRRLGWTASGGPAPPRGRRPTGKPAASNGLTRRNPR